tara:strand:- start:40 stop:642 length:603 start_codon:yes stop_codon:yes gene_type:complete
MGAGAAGSGGSDKSDERKVDTYADQLKKEQARKSKFKKNKFGYDVKKNLFERYVDTNPVIQTVKNVADNLNLNRRMKFANKKGINIQGLSTEQILSKDFKAKLDAQGYTKEPGNVGGNNDNNQSISETPEAKIMPIRSDVITDEKNEKGILPVEDDKDDKYDVRKIKKKGRTKNILTSSKGVTKVSDDYSLGKKSLLGIV